MTATYPLNFPAARSAIPSFSPTKVALFRQCPERYLRHYLVGPRQREAITRPLVRGAAVHALMASYARRSDENWQPNNIDFTGALEAAGLAAGDDGFDANAAQVEQLVNWGIAEFDRRYHAATILAVEDFLAYTHGRSGIPMFRLEAKIDLLVLHPDGIVEHVDYKTGRVDLDETQNMICRIVAGSNANALANGHPVVGQTGIRTTVMFLKDQQTISRIIPRDELHQPWQELQESLAGITEGLATPAVGVAPWLPKPNGLCTYCPFDSVCSRNTVSDGNAVMLDWLTSLQVLK